MKERWRDIPGWEGMYQVSDLGRVYSIPRVVPHPTNRSGYQKVSGRIRKVTIAKNGYAVVSLTFKGKIKLHYVHALVMLAFRGPPKQGQEVCHRDGDRSNAKLSNLRYGTHTQNMKDADDHGTITTSTRNGMAQLNAKEVRKLRRLFDAGVKQADLSMMFGLSQSQVSLVGRRLTYRDIE